MRANTNKFRANAYAYLIDCMIDEECEAMTAADKVRYMASRIRSEQFPKEGLVDECTNFLQGLGMAIAFRSYNEIMNAAGTIHEEDPNEWTETRADKIAQDWFPFMGRMLASLIHYVEAGKTDLIPK